MKALKRLATRHPVPFGLLISPLVLVSYVTAGLLAAVVTNERAGYELAEAVGRVTASLFFLYMLWRFGWLDSSGVTNRGAL